MGETMEAQEAYPLPGGRQLSVKGDEIEYIIIVPKGVKVENPAKASENPEETKDQSMALPKGKPLKVAGTEIETLTIMPKGGKPEEKPAEKPESKTEGSQMKPQEQKELSALQEQLSAAKREKDEVSAKYESLITTIKNGEVQEIVALRLSRGVLKEDQKSEATERLSKLPVDIVHALLSDEKALSPKEEHVSADQGTAHIKLTAGANKPLSEEQQVRQRLYGHADPLKGGEV
jgi:hypothetical protein